KEQIPSSYKGNFDNWAFGCDTCQDVCPWNRFSKPTNEKDFMPHDNRLSWNREEWEEITEEVFKKVFKESPLSRAGYQKVKDNLKIL
ncbi:MAG: tRNA epoxyqueuosine(34) reductase QueG, partial [Bacteroidota bacterium]